MASRYSKDRLFDGLAVVGKAMSSGRRLELLDVLSQGPRSVEHLAGEIDQSVANTSAHLRSLLMAGLVTSDRDGNRVIYRLAGPVVEELWAALRATAEAHAAAIGRLASDYLGDRAELESVTRAELADRLASAAPPLVLDVRPAAEFVAGHVRGAVSLPPDVAEDRLARLSADSDIVAYCRGPFCVYADDAVRALGRRGVREAPGGRVPGVAPFRLARSGRHRRVRRAVVSLVTPIVDGGLGNTSWIVDLGDDRLAVIDPGRHPGRYVAHAEGRGGRVAFSVETHLHADFVTGSRELASFGAIVVASASAGLDWPHRSVAGGSVVDLGGLGLRALATPGHTPEHLAYLLTDGDRPLGVFTGGSLLVGAVARTDLIAPDQTDPLARALWRSVQDQLLTLPDDVPVYPTHGAGSFCSAPATDRRWTTIGDERRTNPLLAAPDEDAFVAALAGGLGTYPPYFTNLREVNRHGPHLLGMPQPPLPTLELATFHRHVEDGAQVVDTRPVATWAAGHVPGALAIALRDQFASWLGWLVDRERPLLFVVGADQDRAELVRQCHQIGHDHIVGELAGGTTAWADAGLPLARTRLVEAAEVEGHVLDVRQRAEYSAGHVPGVDHMELGDLASRLDELGPVDAVMCGHGERAGTAASIIEGAGRTAPAVVVGGPDDWAAAHHCRVASS